MEKSTRAGASLRRWSVVRASPGGGLLAGKAEQGIECPLRAVRVLPQEGVLLAGKAERGMECPKRCGVALAWVCWAGRVSDAAWRVPAPPPSRFGAGGGRMGVSH